MPSPAIVNPNQPECAFPSKHLAGVGVMFYVLAATRARLRDAGRPAGNGPNFATLLDLRGAAGTAASIVASTRQSAFSSSRAVRLASGSREPLRSYGASAASRDRGARPASDLDSSMHHRGETPARHVGRHSPSSRRGRHDRTRARKRADALNRERRDVEATMHEEALATLDLEEFEGR